MTIPFSLRSGGCPSIDEIILPDADILQFPDFTGWELGPGDSGDGWQQLDDTSDTDTIRSFIKGDFPPGIGNCPSTTIYTHRIGLANPVVQPGSSLCQGFKWTVRFRKSPSQDAGVVNMLTELRQGTALIAQNFTDDDISTSYDTDIRTLSDANYSAITDHDDLQIWLIAEVCVDAEFDELSAEVAWCRGEYFTK